ncbi:MAG: helix-turn-helix domain-containing protein [Trueperaceae bacterium]|nr:helix-turn-helix domain-containing protein [Trueperaceae bacterium]
MAHRHGVATVDRAIGVLEAFARAGPSLTPSGLAQHTGMVKSGVLRLAASSVRRGLRRRDTGGGDRLGPALVGPALVGPRRHHLLHFVQVGTQFAYGTGAVGASA